MEVACEEMTGVRIQWAEGRVRPRQGSDFAAFFAPLLPRLRGLTWLVDADAFCPPLGLLTDDELAAFEDRLQWVAAEGDGWHTGCVAPHYVADPEFVADYAAWVHNDWNWLYGFDQPPADWRGWLRAGHRTGPAWQAERAAFLASTTAVCFFSVDHAYWEFFARDAGLVMAAASAAAAGGLMAEPVALAESMGL